MISSMGKLAHQSIHTATSLSKSAILGLAKGDFLALRISNFISPQICKDMSVNLLQQGTAEYKNAKGVYKVNGIGTAFFETTENDDLKSYYYKTAKQSMEDTRHLFHPNTSPLDALLTCCNQVWDPGAELLNLGDGAMFSGLPRVVTNEILPHEDKLERDLGYAPNDYITQMAANVYLQVPSKGGALLLWETSLSDSKYDEMRGESYGIAHDRLPPASCTLMPSHGDLILFNPRYLHAVEKTCGEPRIGISTFIMYCGEDKPLKFWS